MMIVFDAYGTLWDVTALEARCREVVGSAQAGAFLTLWRQKQLEYAFLRTVMDRYQPFWIVTEHALDFTAQALDVSLTPDHRQQLLEAWLHPIPFSDAAATLERLRPATRVILSNGDPTMLAQGVTRLGWDRLLDDVISVDRAGRYKPHPNAYQLICDQYEVTPDAVYFVSSNGWDISGAAHFGFRTVWVNRRRQPFEHLGAQPFAVILELMELPGVLPDHRG